MTGVRDDAAGRSARFDALDSVRGLAAMAVVFDHGLNVFPLFGGASPGQVAPQPGPILTLLLRSPLSLAWNGRAAVAIFFVLSGFVLALPWFRGHPPPYRLFVMRRFCRIYAPYAVAVALAMALSTCLSWPHPAPLSAWFDANWTEPVTVATVSDHLLMLGAHDTFDNAVWSLNHEMRLSLLFPLLLVPILRFGLAGAAATAIALYGIANAVTHFAGWHGAPAEVAATVRFSTFFILGAALAQRADRLGTAHAGPAWLVLTIGLCCLWLSQEPAVMAIGSALVVLAAILPGRLQTILTSPSMQALGRISYSLYLTHLLVLLSAVHLLFGHLPLPIIVGGAWVICLPVAALFHRLIEAPSDQFGRNLARRLRQIAALPAPR